MHVYCAKKSDSKLKFFSLPSKSCGALLKAVKKGKQGLWRCSSSAVVVPRHLIELEINYLIIDWEVDRPGGQHSHCAKIF